MTNIIEDLNKRRDGDADEAVEAFINETLEYNPDGLIIFFSACRK